MEDDMKLPSGKTCGDCFHWKRCKALIQDLDHENVTCDFAPSRFLPRSVTVTHVRIHPNDL